MADISRIATRQRGIRIRLSKSTPKAKRHVTCPITPKKKFKELGNPRHIAFATQRAKRASERRQRICFSLSPTFFLFQSPHLSQSAHRTALLYVARSVVDSADFAVDDAFRRLHGSHDSALGSLASALYPFLRTALRTHLPHPDSQLSQCHAAERPIPCDAPFALRRSSR